jgi:putative transposase
MLRHRGHVARLYPTTVQASKLDGQAHTARALWNLLHEWHTWGDGGRSARRPSKAEMDRQIREARTHPLRGYEWLATLPAQSTQQVLKEYLRALDRFFRGSAGRPRFKQRSRSMAVDNPQASDLRIVRLNRRWGEVTVQGVGRVRFRWTRPLPGVSGSPGRITGARLVKDALGWHIVFRIEEPMSEVVSSPGPPIGVDRGVAHTMALSNGRNLDMPKLLTSGERRRLRRLELQAARRREARRRTPGAPVSNRERLAYKQIALLRSRQARRREDWLHNQTTDLAKNHSLVVLEDLRIQNMTRSARGTLKSPGRNVKAKAGLNRSILSMAWGKANRMLDYKCLLSGGELLKVPAAFSSQTCAVCGRVAHNSRPSRDWFQCVGCGHRAPADTNAAQVLLRRGLAARSGTAPGHGVAGRGVLPMSGR